MKLEFFFFVINSMHVGTMSFASTLGLGGFTRNAIINLKRCRED